MGREDETIPSAIGEYRVERRIGAGGMGVVYLAVSPSGRRVALKVIRGEFVDDSDYRARFRLEVDAARQVSGAFTAPVVGADPEGQRPWMATQFFDAPTLSARVRTAGVLEVDAAWRLAQGLAEALRDIHRAGLVHRDLKPSNVLLTDDGPRVIDFGIARVLEAEPLTRSGRILGTVSFMAPEQLNTPRDVGTAADVFAMGGVLTHAVTGRGPFDGDGGVPPIGVAMNIVHEAPDLTGVPPALRPVIERCLLKDPEGRPSPGELLALLQENGTPVPPPPAARPPRRPVLRRTSVYASTAAALALAGVVAWALLPGEGAGHDRASGRTSTSASAGARDAGADTTSCSGPVTRYGALSGHGKKRITIGVTVGEPGMAMRKPDGSYLGLDIDVARYVARRLGYPPADILWAEVPGCSRLAALEAGVVDLVVSSFTKTTERSQHVDFTSTYLVGHQDLLLHAKAPDVHNAKDLSGKICTVRGSSTAASFRQTFGAKASPVVQPDVEHCVDLLSRNSVVAVTSTDTALSYAALMEADAFKLAGLKLTDEPYAIGLPKGSPLKSEANAALHQMIADGTMAASMHMYLPLLAQQEG